MGLGKEQTKELLEKQLVGRSSSVSRQERFVRCIKEVSSRQLDVETVEFLQSLRKSDSFTTVHQGGVEKVTTYSAM